MSGQPQPTIQAFEGLRGVLALLVLASHVYHVFIRPPNGIFITASHQAVVVVARLAVLFFFVLSGYVIARSIDANRSGSAGFSPGRYFAARAWRIVPPMLATIAITSACGLVLLYAGLYYVSLDSAERMVFLTRSPEQAISLLTLTLAGDLRGAGLNGPLWSLEHEIQLYVMAGLLACMAFGGSPMIRVTAALALAAYLYGVDITRADDLAAERRMAMFLAFAVGAVAYAGRRLACGSALLLTAGLGSAAALQLTLIFLQAGGLAAASSLSVQVLAAGGFAAGLTIVARTWRLERLQWLGGMSYTLYILHFPLLLFCYFLLFNLARPVLAENWAPWTGAVCGGLVFLVCWRVAVRVERPKRLRTWAAGLSRGTRLQRA